MTQECLRPRTSWREKKAVEGEAYTDALARARQYVLAQLSFRDEEPARCGQVVDLMVQGVMASNLKPTGCNRCVQCQCVRVRLRTVSDGLELVRTPELKTLKQPALSEECTEALPSPTNRTACPIAAVFGQETKKPDQEEPHA